MQDELQRQLPHLLPRLWRFALRLTRNPHDAEDLVQRSCVRALERRAQWRPGTALLSWLFAIEHSIWLNELRSAQRRRTGSLDGEPSLEDDERLVSPSGNPELGLHYRQVVMAVEALPEAQRVVMLLVAVEGLSYREAADVLTVPIGTVMSRLSRARSTVGQRFLAQPAATTNATEERQHDRR
jgi:RNA polymerase sigma-70 factor, ECF subfamily